MRPRTNKSRPGFIPLGIDLIEIKKARRFYRAHEDRLGSLFSKKELRTIRRSKKPYERMAVLLAAKEAVFKALRAPWMGPAGFREIRLVPVSRRRPQFKGVRFRLAFENTKNYVIARCYPGVSDTHVLGSD